MAPLARGSATKANATRVTPGGGATKPTERKPRAAPPPIDATGTERLDILAQPYERKKRKLEPAAEATAESRPAFKCVKLGEGTRDKAGAPPRASAPPTPARSKSAPLGPALALGRKRVDNRTGQSSAGGSSQPLSRTSKMTPGSARSVRKSIAPPREDVLEYVAEVESPQAVLEAQRSELAAKDEAIVAAQAEITELEGEAQRLRTTAALAVQASEASEQRAEESSQRAPSAPVKAAPALCVWRRCCLSAIGLWLLVCKEPGLPDHPTYFPRLLVRPVCSMHIFPTSCRPLHHSTFPS